MTDITYKIDQVLNETKVNKLYLDAGWLSYTKNLPLLMTAISNSLMVVSAWSDDELVGLIRIIGDGCVIIYVQDILVLTEYKRQGIGRKLVNIVLDQFKDIRQIVLLTEESQETRGFYESLGFNSCDDGRTIAFAIQK